MQVFRHNVPDESTEFLQHFYIYWRNKTECAHHIFAEGLRVSIQDHITHKNEFVQEMNQNPINIPE